MAYFSFIALRISTRLWWSCKRLSSKTRKLHASTLIACFTLCCFPWPSGSSFSRSSWSHIDSAVAMMSDSFSRVASPCLSPNRKMDSSSFVIVSPVRFVMISLGLLMRPVRILCSRSRDENLRWCRLLTTNSFLSEGRFAWSVHGAPKLNFSLTEIFISKLMEFLWVRR